MHTERSASRGKNFKEGQRPSLAAKCRNNSEGGGDLMADILHGLITILTTPLFAVMILAGIIVGKLTKHR